MRFYHCSYSNVSKFKMSGVVYDDLDIDHRMTDKKRVSLSDAPERALRGFVDAGVLEKGRLMGMSAVTVYVYVCDVDVKDVIPYTELSKQVFDVDVTHESWYVGNESVKFRRIGKISISTAMNHRECVTYRDYGTTRKEQRVYGSKLRRSSKHTGGGSSKLIRGVLGDKEPERRIGSWTVKVLNNDGYLPDVIGETYRLDLIPVGVFNYIGFMKYELIRMGHKPTYILEADNGESTFIFTLDTRPEERSLHNGKIVPNMVKKKRP